MDNLTTFFLQWAIGLMLGLFYFGGLWWTVQRMQEMHCPWLWAGVSFLVRAAILVGGFALLAGGQWSGFFVGLLGFFLARGILIHRYRPQLEGG